MRLRIATRGSELARWQADRIAALVREHDPDVVPELVVVSTSGDRRLDVPIWEMGGKGVFVKEVQAAVLDGRADLAVHSAKDLPSVAVEGLTLAAVPPRGDPRDALVGSTLEALGPGAVIATGSVRRRAQLAWLRPDLVFEGVRGNIATRVDRARSVGAVVVAAAALDRLGLAARATEVLDPSTMLPQVGQGALAVECATDAVELRERLRGIEDAGARRAVDAERAFLAVLGGDCDLPAAAYATIDADGVVALDALLASLDGRIVLREQRRGSDPSAVGRLLARHLLDDAGGSSLLFGDDG